MTEQVTVHPSGYQLAAPSSAPDVHTELNEQFGASTFTRQATADGVPTLWVPKEQIRLVLRYLKLAAPQPYRMLFDLTAIEERARLNRPGQPASDFTVVYQLLSHERNQYLRLKVALAGEQPVLPTITDIWPMANWYEREVWDMFGIRFEGHPHLRHHLTTPPLKPHNTMVDIETLITHFLVVSWGPVIPAGEAICPIESSKGNYSYYLVSDGNTVAYRTRIRAPSFAHYCVDGDAHGAC